MFSHPPEIQVIRSTTSSVSTKFKDKMENIQRDLEELIQKFQVLFNNEDIEQWEWEWDRKKNNDWQILKFAHHLQVHIQRRAEAEAEAEAEGEAEADEFFPLIVPTRGEAIEALHALFEDTEEEDNEEEDTEEEGMETFREKVFHLPWNHSRIRRFISLGYERARSRTL